MKPTEAAIGAPCWVELGTADVAGSGRFYSALFGWTVATGPGTEAGGYTLVSLHDAIVGALSPLYAPSQAVAWTVAFAVLDADATAARAGEEGGRVLIAPTDILDSGRFAVLRDPAGAMFSIWQPRTFQGLGLWDEPGAACWTELETRDVATARAFYQSLLGWSISDDAYPHLSADGREFGGVQDMNAGAVPRDVPAYWLLAFKAQDAAAKAREAVELGAEMLAAPFHVPGTGWFAVLRDPQGAVFAVCQGEGAAEA